MIKQTSQSLLTKAMAARNIAVNKYPGQRAMKPRRVKELEAKLQDGRFTTASIAIAHKNGSTYLMNGQHQSQAVLNTGEEIANLFAQFDDGNVRSSRDVSKAFTVAIGADWPERCANTCAAALALLKHGENYQSTTTKDVRAMLLVESRTQVDWVNATLFGDSKGWLHLVGTVAAAINTLRKSPDDATLFWESVRQGDRLAKSDAAYTLREFLISRSDRGRNGRTMTREIYCKCIYAWNAYRENRPITTLKFLAALPNPEPV